MAIKDSLRKIREKIKSGRKVFQGEKSIDNTYSSKKKFENEESAKKALQDAKVRLFNIASWNKIPGFLSSSFTLYNEHGIAYHSLKPAVNDYIKIELPGPFPPNWVKVMESKDEEDFAQFTVHPSKDPTNRHEPEVVTDHFFKSKSTSTFKVERKGDTLFAYEIGKQEAINKKEPEAGGRPGINTFVAEGGWAGYQKIQWEALTRFLLEGAEV